MTDNLSVTIPSGNGFNINLTPKEDSAKLGRALGMTVSKTWDPASEVDAARDIAFILADVVASGSNPVHPALAYGKKHTSVSLANEHIQTTHHDALINCVQGLLLAVSQNVELLKDELTSFLDGFMAISLRADLLDHRSVREKTLTHLERLLTTYNEAKSQIDLDQHGQFQQQQKDNRRKLAVGIALANIFSTTPDTLNATHVINPFSRRGEAVVSINQAPSLNRMNIWGPSFTNAPLFRYTPMGKLIENIFTKAGGTIQERT